MNRQSNGQLRTNIIDMLIQQHRQIIKKLEEINVKQKDLNEAKKELSTLIKNRDFEIIRSGLISDSDSDE